MQHSPNIHDYFQYLNENTTLITPNRRLSATLHKLYQQYQMDQKNTCWQTPDILPVTTWIQRLWSDYTSKAFIDAPVLLNTTQEHFLWESIISSSKDSAQLLRVSETAEIAKSAWGVLKQWLVALDHPMLKSTDDDSTLYHWSNEFQKICKKNGWIDSASLTDLVIEKIKSNALVSTKKVILIGFTELSPQLKQLIDVSTRSESFLNIAGLRGGTGSSFSRAACEHGNEFPVTGPREDEPRNDSLEASAADSHYRRIALTDSDDEILTIARWAKLILQSARDPSSQTARLGMTAYGGVRIGCVIPSLDKIRNRVIQIFSEVFDNDCFNISAGKPLLQCPIIYTALQLLGLHKKVVSIDIFSGLLTSPFLGSAEYERIKRANLDSQLRRENITTIHLSSLGTLKNSCPHLIKRIEAFFTRLNDLAKEQNYSVWANVFNELLSILGWPGERSLNSEEYQIVEHWLRLLEEFSTLD